MALYTIQNLFPIKDILKALPSRGINNYIKIFAKTAFWKNSSERTWQNGIR